MTYDAPATVSRSTRVTVIVLTVLAPIVMVIAWWVGSDAHFDYTFKDLPFATYAPVTLATAAIGLGFPIVVLLHSLVVRVRARARGQRAPFEGFLSGGISLLAALPMLFTAGPLVAYEIDLTHAPTAEETSVSSTTLLARATAFENQTAAHVGLPIVQRDPASAFACDLSNGHLGKAYSVPVRMGSEPTSAQIDAVVAYWKSLGYTTTHEGLAYETTALHQLTLRLVVGSGFLGVTVTTSCVTS